MARHLQEKYREYGRRKQQPFRFLVDQAYKTVLRSYGLDSNPSTEEEENSDVELMEVNDGISFLLHVCKFLNETNVFLF